MDPRARLCGRLLGPGLPLLMVVMDAADEKRETSSCTGCSSKEDAVYLAKKASSTQEDQEASSSAHGVDAAHRAIRAAAY